MDLRVWDMFLEQYNDSPFWMGPAFPAADLDLYTDASGSVGYAAYFHGRWSAGSKPEGLKGSDLIRNLALL